MIVDSAGTGDWHVGEPPDPRAQAVARKHGVDISPLRGRQIKPADFRRFTHIVALDAQNLDDLRRLAPADATAELSLLLDHVEGREGQPVTDPYFGDDEGFNVAWADVVEGAKGLAQRLRRSGAD
ncbi:Low molecular weight protein-tyrosine-phosphatase YfkJ [compost metagenome]